MLNLSLTSYQKLTQNGSKTNTRHKTIKLLKENIEENLGIGFGIGLSVTPKAQTAKEKINWTPSKLEIFVHQRMTLPRK